MNGRPNISPTFGGMFTELHNVYCGLQVWRTAFSFGGWDLGAEVRSKDPRRDCPLKNKDVVVHFFLFSLPQRLGGMIIKQRMVLTIKVKFCFVFFTPIRLMVITDIAVRYCLRDMKTSVANSETTVTSQSLSWSPTEVLFYESLVWCTTQ